MHSIQQQNTLRREGRVQYGEILKCDSNRLNQQVCIRYRPVILFEFFPHPDDFGHVHFHAVVGLSHLLCTVQHSGGNGFAHTGERQQPARCRLSRRWWCTGLRYSGLNIRTHDLAAWPCPANRPDRDARLFSNFSCQRCCFYRRKLRNITLDNQAIRPAALQGTQIDAFFASPGSSPRRRENTLSLWHGRLCMFCRGNRHIYNL